jgi:hypothetical protein
LIFEPCKNQDDWFSESVKSQVLHATKQLQFNVDAILKRVVVQFQIVSLPREGSSPNALSRYPQSHSFFCVCLINSRCFGSLH